MRAYEKKEWNVNQYLLNWFVLDVIECENTGYLGIIYVNHGLQQLVLGHRSTNFGLSLTTKNLFKQSGAHQDIAGVLLGNILLHQGYGYLATKNAVIFAQTIYKNYSLSFTGHSLGAWLATLSVLYCHDSFKFEFVQAITFDGPGCLEMMKKLRTGDIKGPSTNHKYELKDLDIVTYLSAPNVVNCSNKHVGTVYALFPLNIKDTLKSTENGTILNYIENIIIDNIPNQILTNFGHDLKYILPLFDPISGRPENYLLIEKWPSISYDRCGKYSASFSFSTKIIRFFTSFLPLGMIMTDQGIELCSGAIKSLNLDSTTVFSIAHLAMLLYAGQIDMHQFWLVHHYLDNNTNFVAQPLDTLGQFFLENEAQYKVVSLSVGTSIKTESKIDKCMKILATNKLKLQGQELIDIANVFQYKKTTKEFCIEKEYGNSITIEDIRHQIKALCHRNSDFEDFLNNINEPRIENNLGNVNDISHVETSAVEILLKNHKLVIITGMTGMGKTTMAKILGNKIMQDFTPVLLNGSSLGGLDKSLQECLNFLIFDDEYTESLKRQYPGNFLIRRINKTKQKVAFILDNVKEFVHISKFIQTFSKLPYVRFIITTQNDKLYDCNNILRIKAERILNDNSRHGIQERVEKILEDLFAKDEKVHKPAQDILKILHFVKPDQLSKQTLLTKLSYKNYTRDAALCALDKLQIFSFVTIGSGDLLGTNVIVQDISLKYFDSVCDCLMFLSLFNSMEIFIEKMYCKILTPDLVSEVICIKALDSSINVEQKCNLVNIFSLLLKQVKLKPEYATNNILNTLDDLKSYFVRLSDLGLQNLMTNLTDGWLNIDNNEKAKESLKINEQKINSSLTAFHSFAQRAQECYSGNIGPCEGSGTLVKHVLVIGPTGSGKTTIINHLIGNILECTQVGRNGIETIIDVKKIGNNLVGGIGNNSASSETNSITAYFNEETRNVIYWDFPGFFDSRGEMQKIQHAFLMKSFTESVNFFQILLVFESSTIFAEKGKGFIDLLNTMSQLCNLDQIQNSLSLLITKCDSYETKEQMFQDKCSFRQAFSKLLDEHRVCSYAGYLKMLKESDLSKMALFPRVTTQKVGEVDFFKDLDNAISSSKSTNIVFNLSMDDETHVKITRFTHLLNEYALSITQDAVQTRDIFLKSMIEKITFRKINLLEIGKFSMSALSVQEFVNKFRDITGDLLKTNILNDIIKIIQFFNRLNSCLSPTLSNWIEPTIRSDAMFDQLISKPTINIRNQNILEFKSTILFTSEIIELFERTKAEKVNQITCQSYLFIVDKDIILPGISVSIGSTIWRIIGDKTINLKSLLGDKLENSGNFYGIQKNITGGKISFDLDGTDGQEGGLNASQLQEKIELKNTEIYDLTKQIEAIEELTELTNSSFMLIETLDIELNKYVLKMNSYKTILENYQKTILELDERLVNLFYEKRYEDLQQKRKIEIYLVETQSELHEIEQSIEIIEKIIQLTKIRDEYNNFSKIYEPTTVYTAPNDETIENRFIESIGDIHKQISNLENNMVEFIEKGDLTKYEEFQNIFEKTKVIAQCLDDAVRQRDPEYCIWVVELKKMKAKFTHKESIQINNTVLEISPEDLNENLKNILKIIKNAKEQMMMSIKLYKTHKDGFSKDVKHFNKKHMERIGYENKMENICSNISLCYKKLKEKFPTEFDDAIQIIENLTSSIENKHKATLKLNGVVGSYDIKMCTSNIKYKPLKRELLMPINYYEFAKDSKDFLEKMSSKMQPEVEHSNMIRFLRQISQLKAKMYIFSVKANVNKLVRQHNLDEKYKFLINNEENNLEDSLKEVYKQVRNWWSKNRWFGNIRANKITDAMFESLLQEQCQIQENLSQRLECALEYEEKFVDSYLEFENANEHYEQSKKHYKDWKNEYQGSEPQFLDFIKICDDFFQCKQVLSDSFNEEAKIAHQLLLKSPNLVNRVARKWDDMDLKNKALHVLKEILIYTGQYYEHYKLSGSEGTKGNNSGAFIFGGAENYISKLTQQPGQGGQNACILEGTYLNEYSFPLIRGIKETNNSKRLDLGQMTLINYAKLLACYADDIALEFATLGTTATKFSQLASVGSVVVFGACLAISPIVAIYGSRWVDGPYKTIQDVAKNGEKRKFDSSFLDNFNFIFRQYTEYDVTDDIKSIIPFSP